MAANKVTIRSLKERCKILERHVRRRELATEEELRDYRPGGKDNSGPRSLWSWIYWFAQLTRFSGREDILGGPGGVATEEADAIILDALRNAPQAVKLTPQDDGTPRSMKVYPKSLDALLHVHARDECLNWLTKRFYLLKENAEGPGDLELLDRVATELSHQYQVIIWIVCSEGPQMPFETADSEPNPPDWAEVDPIEAVAIFRVHLEVNGNRLKALNSLVSPYSDDGKDGRTKRPSWSTFVGALAVRMKMAPEELMKDRALAELLAMVKLANDAERPSGNGTRDEHGFTNDDRTHLGPATESTTYKRKVASAPGGRP